MATDTDQSTRSDHHTLGIRATQASPGDHIHDGVTSNGISELIAAGAAVTWDGATLNVPSTNVSTSSAFQVTQPGDIRLPRNDGGSPGIVTSAGNGGIRFILIPGSAENSIAVTPAGVITLCNGQTSIGGSVNIRNPSAAALTQHTLTLQTLGSQTGDIVRIVNSNNSAVVFSIPASARVNIANTDTLVAGTASSYGLNITAVGGITAAYGSDANGGYLQTFSGKPLFVNKAGNEVQFGASSLGRSDSQGHFGGIGGAPTVAAGAGLGTAPPAITTGGASADQQGNFGFGTGTTPSAAAVLTVTFAHAWTNTPRVVLQPTTAAANNIGLYVSSMTTTGFTISAAVAPAASQANTVYGVNYVCMG